MISRSTIEKILRTTVIEEVVGDFVQLKKSGSAYKARSPFSNEKTPSFFVVPAKNIYKDFSSGKGGNAVDFLMQHEKLTYPEALRWLAAKYNIEIEEEQQTEEQQQQKSEREQLSIVNEFAGKYFQQQMHETEEGQAVALAYFQERGFREDIIKKFQLGYCPDKWDAMTQAALEKSYSKEYLIKAGLTREKDGKTYDFFRGRVMFPIHNISGKVIAFGGRTLKVEKDLAKYFNSPESELYIKSKTLYGLHLAKNEIVKQDMCYLCEGYTDVISLHQSGVENAVASSGTSLTEEQIKLIRRYTQNITILYDGDNAGIKASFRGIDMILKEGMNVRIVLFPDGDDPDSYCKKHSSSEVQNFLQENAKDFITFKTHLLAEEAGNDPVKRAALIKGIVDSIALIPDNISRSVYVQECSRLLKMQEQVLLSSLNKTIASNYKKLRQESLPEEIPVLDESPSDGIPAEGETSLSLYYQEKDLIRLLLSYGEREIEITVINEEGRQENHTVSVAEFLITNLEQDELTLETPTYASIYTEYVQFTGRNEIPRAEVFTQHPQSSISTESSGLLVSPYHLSENWTTRHHVYPETEEMLLRKAAQDCVNRLKLQKVRLISKQLDIAIGEAAHDEEKLENLLREKIQLDKTKADIARYFGTVILD